MIPLYHNIGESPCHHHGLNMIRSMKSGDHVEASNFVLLSGEKAKDTGLIVCGHCGNRMDIGDISLTKRDGS